MVNTKRGKLRELKWQIPKRGKLPNGINWPSQQKKRTQTPSVVNSKRGKLRKLKWKIPKRAQLPGELKCPGGLNTGLRLDPDVTWRQNNFFSLAPRPRLRLGFAESYL